MSPTKQQQQNRRSPLSTSPSPLFLPPLLENYQIINNGGGNTRNLLDQDNGLYKTEQIISKIVSLLLTFLSLRLKKQNGIKT